MTISERRLYEAGVQTAGVSWASTRLAERGEFHRPRDGVALARKVVFAFSTRKTFLQCARKFRITVLEAEEIIRDYWKGRLEVRRRLWREAKRRQRKQSATA